MFDLTGKTALVTGASGGIGGAIAAALHAAGATVALSGTRTAPLEALAAELGSRAHVPDDVIEFLARKITANVRELEGALRAAGVDEFIFVGADVLASLEKAHAELGLARVKRRALDRIACHQREIAGWDAAYQQLLAKIAELEGRS